MPTARPTLLPALTTNGAVPLNTWNTDVQQSGLWQQELIAGTGVEKISYSAPDVWPSGAKNILVDPKFNAIDLGAGPFTPVDGQVISDIQIVDGWWGVYPGTYTILPTGSKYGTYAIQMACPDPTKYGWLYQRMYGINEFRGRIMTASVRFSGSQCLVFINDGGNSVYGNWTDSGGGWQTAYCTAPISMTSSYMDISVLTSGTAIVDEASMVCALGRINYPIPAQQRRERNNSVFFKKSFSARFFSNHAGEIAQWSIPLILGVPTGGNPIVTSALWASAGASSDNNIDTLLSGAALSPDRSAIDVTVAAVFTASDTYVLNGWVALTVDNR